MNKNEVKLLSTIILNDTFVLLETQKIKIQINYWMKNSLFEGMAIQEIY